MMSSVASGGVKVEFGRTAKRREREDSLGTHIVRGSSARCQIVVGRNETGFASILLGRNTATMFWRRSHEGDEVIQIEGYSNRDRRKETGVGLLKRTAGRGKPRREEALGWRGGEEG